MKDTNWPNGKDIQEILLSVQCRTLSRKSCWIRSSPSPWIYHYANVPHDYVTSGHGGFFDTALNQEWSSAAEQNQVFESTNAHIKSVPDVFNCSMDTALVWKIDSN